jgi:hypothetical protein
VRDVVEQHSQQMSVYGRQALNVTMLDQMSAIMLPAGCRNTGDEFECEGT